MRTREITQLSTNTFRRRNDWPGFEWTGLQRDAGLTAERSTMHLTRMIRFSYHL